ncbi:hypothetical protein DPX39_040032300 [Trypanosoma brucei equiperdum]|uniref:Uncharacterized protein n=1 Tax=Trypanosoma brucei equiperdum TaxID=630700 RepID=A0A3L6L7V2_9TRYP|nr:hypothetical protein DPX39_040032300 [Trypanosoma brucei equiperdum]
MFGILNGCSSGYAALAHPHSIVSGGSGGVHVP